MFLLSFAGLALVSEGAEAGWPGRFWGVGSHPAGTCVAEPCTEDIGGSWYWLRSPEQEKRIIMSLYNRYCIRCHGVDGRASGTSRTCPILPTPAGRRAAPTPSSSRFILEGRGAVMPAFRGTLTLEEAWAMSRYLRTSIPGSEMARPDHQQEGQKRPAICPHPRRPGAEGAAKQLPAVPCARNADPCPPPFLLQAPRSLKPTVSDPGVRDRR